MILLDQCKIFLGIYSIWGKRTPRGFSPGSFFSGFRCFFRSFSPSLLFSSSFFLVAGLGAFSCSSFARLAGRRRTPATCTGGSSCLHVSSLLCLPGSVACLPPFLSPSFCPLSLSLACAHRDVSIWSGHHLAQITVNLVDLASIHMLVSETKPACLSVSASQQGCKWLINPAMIFAVLHHTRITVENLGLIQVTCLTFWE